MTDFVILVVHWYSCNLGYIRVSVTRCTCSLLVAQLTVWVVWARWRRDGLTPGLPQGTRRKTRDGGETHMCLPDVLLGVQRWFVRLRRGGEKTAGHGAQ